MAPKKATVETSTSPNREAEKELKEQHADGPEEGSKPVKRVSPHPTTMDMVKNALMELDQRKGVSAQAIRTFIKGKYTTVDETRLKTMVRKALVKGIDSGTFVRPANSASMTTGAQGRFRLAVRKLKPVKSNEAKENTNPNISKAKELDARTGDAKTKKTKSAAVEGDKPKKAKNNALASKVAPAKKPKAKRAAGAEGGLEPKPQKTSKASTGDGGEKSGAKKRGKAAQKAEEGLDEGSEVGPLKKGGKKEVQKSKDGGNKVDAPAQKKGGKKVVQKADNGGEQNGTKSSGKKGKKAVEK